MMRRAVATVALAGLVMLGAGAHKALGQCYQCLCQHAPPQSNFFVTACSGAPIDYAKCPACSFAVPVQYNDPSQSCNAFPECLALLSRSPAPALSGVSLAGLGVLLLGGGIWLTLRNGRPSRFRR